MILLPKWSGNMASDHGDRVTQTMAGSSIAISFQGPIVRLGPH